MPPVIGAADRVVVGAPVAPRLGSLDTFRGITIATMLIVSNPGRPNHTYAQLRHADWHGWTVTDLVFPFFLFIVGLSMAMSVEGRVGAGARRRDLLARALRRAAILFGLGLLVNSYPDWWTDLLRHHLDVRTIDLSGFRIMGVLQRIALASLAAAPFVLWCRTRGQAIAASVCLLGYWAIMSWVPVPPAGAGVWEPGRDVGAYIDRALLGTRHLGEKTWDAAGLLGTVPAVANVLLGALAGVWVGSARTPRRKAIGLLVAGAAGVALGVWWNAVLPINKNLWTSSYAVFSTGLALAATAACYWLVDVAGYRAWARPFVVLGRNAILVYVMSELAMLTLHGIRLGPKASPASAYANYLLNHVVLRSTLSPANASLVYAFTILLFWIGFAALLDRRGIYFKI